MEQTTRDSPTSPPPLVSTMLTIHFHQQKKPYSAITVQIERLTGEDYGEHDIAGIPDLVEVIKIQDTGPTEAARAIRKKLYVFFD
jgi:hypothetical protein